LILLKPHPIHKVLPNGSNGCAHVYTGRDYSGFQVGSYVKGHIYKQNHKLPFESVPSNMFVAVRMPKFGRALPALLTPKPQAKANGNLFCCLVLSMCLPATRTREKEEGSFNQRSGRSVGAR
jgi:hypothetical protein